LAFLSESGVKKPTAHDQRAEAIAVFSRATRVEAINCVLPTTN